MKVNDSGDLVPDQKCLRTQNAIIPSASPSTHTPTTESQGSIDVIVAISIPISLALVITIVVCLIVLRMYSKHRNKRKVVTNSTSFLR